MAAVQVTAIKTHKITRRDKDLLKILDRYLPSLNEGSVLVVTSKIVSICEGRIVKIGQVDKKKLIEKEAEFFLPPHQSQYNFTITIKNGLLIPSAGIDESNGNGYYVLWPRYPQESANRVRQYLIKRFSLKNVGVIITDSKTTPLRWGVTGVAIAHSGFLALKSYIGKPDVFGRKLKVTKVNVVDALAAAAVLIIGEGNEQTPLAVIKDLPFLKFEPRNPTKTELENLKIAVKDDLYAPLLQSAKWQRGKRAV